MECDINNGSCECKVGYAGNPCIKCPENCDPTGCDDNFHCYACNSGFYGDFCNETCPGHCLNNTCNRDGRCHECDPGFYGDYCNLICSTNCINGTCNRDGACTCKIIFDGFGCCPENCKEGCNDTNFVCSSCKEVYHGDFCNQTCPDNCTNGCTRDGKKCTSCALRHSGALCEKDCPEQCSRQCEQDNGTCPCNPGFVGRQCQRKSCFLSELFIQNT